jgi:predicted Zn-dependent protease with MMP-like domain
MELSSPFDLLGLYRGTSLRNKSVHDVRQDVDMIHLYRRSLLDYWAENDVTLYDLVRNTIIHEVGHHFGLNDDDMERLESE